LKVTDINDVLLGYYRGHKLTEQGEKIYCLYKTKRFFILENLILLRCMDTHSYERTIDVIDEKTKKVKESKKERGVSFEEILDSKFIGAAKHPTRKNQIVLKFEYKKYIWIMPCVVKEEYIFLKTLFPSRKYTIKYNKNEVKNE
jgi:hypothetical protein